MVTVLFAGEKTNHQFFSGITKKIITPCILPKVSDRMHG